MQNSPCERGRGNDVRKKSPKPTGILNRQGVNVLPGRRDVNGILRKRASGNLGGESIATQGKAGAPPKKGAAI